MTNYIKKADHVTGASRSLARLSHVLGADAPVANPSSTQEFLRSIGASRPRSIEDGVGTIAGAGVGAYLYRDRHPFLGLLGGASLGRNVPALLNVAQRKEAIGNLITTAAGIYGSLSWKKHQVLGYLLGHIAGNVASNIAGLE
jgi:hypothetical protein